MKMESSWRRGILPGYFSIKIHGTGEEQLISPLPYMKSSPIIGGFALRLLTKADTLDDQKEDRYLEIIRGESGKLEMLISDFLEFARLQTGKLKLNLSATSLDKELMELCEAYQPKVSSAGLTLKLENENALPAINGDPRQLRRVFTNLLDNAVKFSPKGGNVIVSTGTDEKEVSISIKDQGMGISADGFILTPIEKAAKKSRASVQAKQPSKHCEARR
jgi:signal transduction histidine kinase